MTFFITYLNFYQMFLAVNQLQMFEPGSSRRMVLQIQTREPIKHIRIAKIFAKRPWLEMAKEGIVHIKNMQINKMNIIQHIA